MVTVRRQTRGTGLLLSLVSARTFGAAGQVLRTHGLSPRSFTVLENLLEGPLSQRELAERLELDPSRIVALVDALVAAGYAERRPDETDRRVRLVTVTDLGRSTAELARVESENAVDQVLDVLDDDERATFVALLERIVDRH